MRVLGRGLVCYAFWYACTFPLAPSIYSLYRNGWSCITGAFPKELFTSAGECLFTETLTAPILLLPPPLTVEDPINPWPAMLGIAAVTAAAALLLSIALGRKLEQSVDCPH